MNWTGDASTGTVPATKGQIGQAGILQGYFITSIETVPQTPAPTNGYGLTIKDQAGVDVLAGAAAALSATTPAAFSASPALPPLNGTFTLTITGQSQAGAKGVVYVYMQDPSTLVGSGGAGTPGTPGSPGSPGATGATGPQGPAGTFPVTLGPLQFLQGQPNVLPQAYQASNLPYLVAGDFNFPAQLPGGSVAIGSNTKTLVPCPLGLAGADSNHYIRLSAGTGTAEAVLITGGTCTSGAASGTVIFTAANTHSGAYTITPASAGIQEAINYLPVAGGEVRMPSGSYDLYATVHIGDGSISGVSSRNGVSLRGDGIGSAITEDGPASAPTRLNWVGPTSGIMMQLNGPISGVYLDGFRFLCGTSAATALKVIHAYHSQFRRLQATDFTSIGFILTAYSTPVGVAIGANQNTWETIDMTSTVDGVTGWQVGAADIGSPPYLDVAGNVFTMVQIRLPGLLTTGMEFRFTDHLTFLHCQLASTGPGAKLTKTPSSTGFPGVIWMFMSIVQGVETSAGLDDQTPINLFPYAIGDGEPVPTGVNAVSGMGTDGKVFGRFMKGIPLLFSTVTSSTAILNTVAATAFSRTFSIPAYMIQAGAVLRVKAAGIYSTTGTPTLTFNVRLGGTAVTTFTAMPCQNNATGHAWSVSGEAIARSTPSNASAVIQRSRGLGTTTTVSPGDSLGQSFTLDTTASQVVDVTVQWSAASSSNTITLTSLDVELMQPSNFN